jgi:predicted esterase
MLVEIKHHLINVPLTINYWQSDGTGSDKSAVLFLHGYSDSARSFLRRLGFWEKELPFGVIAPNAPFPVPVKDGTFYKEAFSWYFMDSSRKSVLIAPEVAVKLLVDFFRDQGWLEKKIIVVGFSQGGFLAPRLVPALKNIERIICVGSRYRADAYSDWRGVRVDAVHGASDEVINPGEAQSDFEALDLNKYGGSFHVIENMTHRITETCGKKVLELLTDNT